MKMSESGWKSYKRKPEYIRAIEITEDNIEYVACGVGGEVREALVGSGSIVYPTLDGLSVATIGDFLVKGEKGRIWTASPTHMAINYLQAPEPVGEDDRSF